MKPVYQYDDYRAFLKDAYAEKKGRVPGLTYKDVAEAVGFQSCGYFTQIIKGKTNITLERVHGFAEYFGLNKTETDFFEALVLFNQARTHNEKRMHYEKMISFRKATVTALDAQQYEFFTNWHYTAIREILNIYRFKGDYEELAGFVHPAISAEQAKDAVSTLEKIGLVAKSDEGVYSLTQKHIRSQFSQSPAHVNYIANSLEIARKSIDSVPKEERQLSSVTISVSPQGYEEITAELQACRDRIREIAGKHSDASRAYQFNFQVYPISKPIPEEKR